MRHGAVVGCMRCCLQRFGLRNATLLQGRDDIVCCNLCVAWSMLARCMHMHDAAAHMSHATCRLTVSHVRHFVSLVSSPSKISCTNVRVGGAALLDSAEHRERAWARVRHLRVCELGEYSGRHSALTGSAVRSALLLSPAAEAVTQETCSDAPKLSAHRRIAAPDVACCNG